MRTMRKGAPMRDVRMLRGISLLATLRATQSATMSSKAPNRLAITAVWVPPRRVSSRAMWGAMRPMKEIRV